MNIELSTKEYRDLLDILHIADVVLSGHRREKDKRRKQHLELIRKLYALAQDEEGLERLIGYNERVNAYIPTAEFEESSVAHVAIDEFGGPSSASRSLSVYHREQLKPHEHCFPSPCARRLPCSKAQGKPCSAPVSPP